MVTLFEEKKPDDLKKDSETEVSSPTPPLSLFIRSFLATYEENLKKLQKAHGATIRVSDVLSSIAYLYERIRNIIEYKGEHVLRRNAIERILKRLLWERSAHETGQMARVLVRELIWAHYLANDAVAQDKVREVAKIIDKYLYMVSRVSNGGSAVPPPKLKDWIWGIASCEIEENLDPVNREPYVELMFDWFKEFFVWQDETLSDHEKQIQIYLAVHRALTKSDDPIMRYHLLIKEYPDWANSNKKDVDEMSNGFYRIYEEIEKHLRFERHLILYRTVQKHVAPFEVLRTLLEEEGANAKQTIMDSEKLEWKVREICHKKYTQIQKKVNRGIIRSIIYIFATKVLLAMLIEIPYELYRFGALTAIPIGINILVPPAMMLLIGLTIRAPGENNTVRIVNKLKTVVYESPAATKTSFSLAHVKRDSVLSNFFALFYLVLFIFVFGAITYGLISLHFTLVGIIIFFAFLSLVLLFGFRVRFTASELKVTSEREGIIGYLFNNLTLPFLSTGVFLSRGLSKLNFLTLILDFLIEAPLKTIIEVVEEWTSFIREKREEVVEVPE